MRSGCETACVGGVGAWCVLEGTAGGRGGVEGSQEETSHSVRQSLGSLGLTSTCHRYAGGVEECVGGVVRYECRSRVAPQVVDKRRVCVRGRGRLGVPLSGSSGHPCQPDSDAAVVCTPPISYSRQDLLAGQTLTLQHYFTLLLYYSCYSS